MKHVTPDSIGLTYPIPRLIRFVPGNTFPDDSVVATLDFERNLLRVNSSIWDTLDRSKQDVVLRSTHPLLSLDDLPAK